MITIIMPNGVFAGGFIGFIRKNFDEEVRFILVGKGDSSVRDGDFEGVGYADTYAGMWKSRPLASQIAKSDAIILSYVERSSLRRLYPYRRKVALWFWGADLRDLKTTSDSTLYQRLSSRLAKWLIERFAFIFTLLPCDWKTLQGLLAPRGLWHQAIMWDDELENVVVDDAPPRQGDGGVKVLLGNSATRTNRHIEALYALSRFSGEDFLIFAPLSYGDQEYAQKVIEVGDDLFGERFVPILDWMDQSEYRKLLSDVSIGVFNNDRQQALGNIRLLIAQGAKLYISEKSTMLDDLLAEGYAIHSFESVEGETFAEFCEISSEEAERNRRIGSFGVKTQEAIDCWKDAFDMVMGRGADSADSTSRFR